MIKSIAFTTKKNREPRLVLLLAFFVFFAESLQAQTPDKLPPFSMTLTNGAFFRAADIKKEKPVLLIYFAPDCDHCHTLMNDFFKRTTDFAGAEIILVTFKPLTEVRAFEQAFQTVKYPNIKVGTEGTTNYLRLFYKLQHTPFAALYRKDGKLAASYRKDVPLNELLKKLKAL